MRVLLIYPLFPKSYWSFDAVLELIDRKALLPPLGLVTVAAILPQEWEFKLVDRNIRDIEDSEWDWADLVILSGMIVQKEDLLAQVRAAKDRGKPVAVGGPYATSLYPEVQAAGADYLVLDEGELTLPMFVEALDRGETSGIFRATEKPDVSQTPIARFDLLEFDAYDSMSVQFSRGCPFQCEFCDIIVLYGRKPRTKTPQQFIAELDRLYELGWRRPIFLVDDNFIGNKRNVKLLLRELKPWLRDRGYPFDFSTEASIDLANDPELMELMVEANFTSIFIGIETPDTDSLKTTKKFQNTRDPLAEAVQTIVAYGMRVKAGFIIGFDGEKTGAGDRIVEFVEKTAIPMPMLSMLQVLPDTGLMHRLKKEGRLLDWESGMMQTTLMNFIPTRPLEEIAREYLEAFWKLYEPVPYLDRVYRHFMMMGERRNQSTSDEIVDWKGIRALAIVLWRQGVKRETRWTFWRYLFDILRYKPSLFVLYMSTCALTEHFLEYRELVRRGITSQLEMYLAKKAQLQPEETPEAIAV